MDFPPRRLVFLLVWAAMPARGPVFSTLPQESARSFSLAASTIRAASSAADRLAVSPHQFIVAALSFPIGPCRLVGGIVVAARADKGLEVTGVAAGERRGSGGGVRLLDVAVTRKRRRIDVRS